MRSIRRTSRRHFRLDPSRILDIQPSYFHQLREFTEINVETKLCCFVDARRSWPNISLFIHIRTGLEFDSNLLVVEPSFRAIHPSTWFGEVPLNGGSNRQLSDLSGFGSEKDVFRIPSGVRSPGPL